MIHYVNVIASDKNSFCKQHQLAAVIESKAPNKHQISCKSDKNCQKKTSIYFVKQTKKDALLMSLSVWKA
jgi:hypothetical protein